LNDALKRDSKHIFVDVTWGPAPIDFIYCIGKKNIHLLNKGYFEGINSPLMGIHHPIESAKKPGSSGALNRAFKAGRLPLS
jgi:hypothetical protein